MTLLKGKVVYIFPLRKERKIRDAIWRVLGRGYFLGEIYLGMGNSLLYIFEKRGSKN